MHWGFLPIFLFEGKALYVTWILSVCILLKVLCVPFGKLHVLPWPGPHPVASGKALWGQKQESLRSCWPACLTNTASFQFSGRRRVEAIRWKTIREELGCLSMHVWGLHTCSLTHKQTSLSLWQKQNAVSLNVKVEEWLVGRRKEISRNGQWQKMITRRICLKYIMCV